MGRGPGQGGYGAERCFSTLLLNAVSRPAPVRLGRSLLGAESLQSQAGAVTKKEDDAEGLGEDVRRVVR